MRKNRNQKSRIGGASKESLSAMEPILQILKQNQLLYYLGIQKNKEWFIYDKIKERAFFYDLTIPSLSIIIEYHGEGFHANPSWNLDKQLLWRAPFSKISFNESLEFDLYKKHLAEDNGWRVFEIYSSQTKKDVEIILEYISKLGYS